MSDPDAKATSRLSSALDQIFGRDDDYEDEFDDEPYVLPEIVPAVVDEPDSPAAPTGHDTVAEPATRVIVPQVAPVGPVPVIQPQVTGWPDHAPAMTRSNPSPGLRAPGRRPRVRKVTRVVRHIDPWSTFKVAVLFSAVAYVVCLTSGVLLWNVADRTGTLDNVERWFTQFGWETFEFNGEEIFHNAWVIGLFAAVALTGAIVLLATLFNLVSDIIGGVRVTVLEEEVVERTISSSRRYAVRRTTIGATGRETAPADWDVDADTGAVPVVAPVVSTAPEPDWDVDADTGAVPVVPAPAPAPTQAPVTSQVAARPVTADDLPDVPASADWSVDDD